MSKTTVTVVEAANFRSGFNDLYCEVLTGIEYSCTSIVRTGIVKSTNHHVLFNETFTLETDGCRLLTIYLKSKNLLTSDEVVGMVQVPIAYFHHQRPSDSWYHFDKGNGSIHLVIQFIDPYLRSQSDLQAAPMVPPIHVQQPAMTQPLIPPPPKNLCPYPGCT